MMVFLVLVAVVVLPPFFQLPSVQQPQELWTLSQDDPCDLVLCYLKKLLLVGVVKDPTSDQCPDQQVSKLWVLGNLDHNFFY